MNFSKIYGIAWYSAPKRFDEYNNVNYSILADINDETQEQIYTAVASINRLIINEMKTISVFKDSQQPNERF